MILCLTLNPDEAVDPCLILSTSDKKKIIEECCDATLIEALHGFECLFCGTWVRIRYITALCTNSN